ncbi:glycosyltransferase family 2 protein [Allorhodopirellula heiligendammensis]|uniref:GalNAc(5)-diNAcBac-PP-undecaprenol beta-1,3-glucosyltransferase n=1 Tax=Allorhodopirellula heiligendammensis TaxID=2714739 RepID=A0A5C6BVJ0_9BACT|nr:glycosyltransferase family 2 protein [Allorhodopirellula heiligendammensis]TWU15236.1 GalNAc(5)-diNAcBac-PP-undecaprenol beta-1,3-glucosyltransferase [Allorhodopirellula heiligendammensis]
MKSLIPAPLHNRCGWPWDAAEVQVASTSQPTWPRITVVTPSFNQGAFLEETIRSVLLQNYPNLEYIVVDGGSTDGSGEVLDHYADHISQVIREPDDGQSDAICKGLDRATGELFNWINSDDRLAPGTLCELAQRFDGSYDLYAFNVAVEDAQGQPPTNGDATMVNRNLSAIAMLRCDRYSFSQPGLWFRMSMLRGCGGIDRSLNYGFDWDLIVRYLSEHSRVQYTPSVGAMFRLHDQSKTMVETSKANAAENRFQQENERIRDKLERRLPPRLAAASKLGRRREPWNQYLIDVLDDFERSPMAAACEIVREIVADPRTRASQRAFGSVARLLSRYVRRMPQRTAL